MIKTVITGPDDPLTPLSVAAECAADHDTFERFHHAAMEADSPSFSSAWLEVAEEVGLEEDEPFLSCVRTRRHLTRLVSQMSQAVDLGIDGTPGILVAGGGLVGELSIAELEGLIALQLRAYR